jgi:uroporphyrin-III C-methyltransferase
VVENAARPEMRVLRGPLAGLGRLVADHHVVSPALIIIGAITALEDTSQTQTTGAVEAEA